MFNLRAFLNSDHRVKVMGIVNATGDSFSEGADSSPDSALERAEALLADGADIIDLGGESTRPGAPEVPPEAETARIVPVLRELKRRHPGAVVSIDTRNAATAAAALEAGAVIINDVSMLRHDPGLAAVTARAGAALVLNHSRGTPENMRDPALCSYPDGVVQTVARELDAARCQALAAGVTADNILLDPGIGFAKTPAQCWELLRNFERVAAPERQLIGVSRKFFLGELTGEPLPSRRTAATLAVELNLALRGVAVLRTHAVRDLRAALAATEKLTENAN